MNFVASMQDLAAKCDNKAPYEFDKSCCYVIESFFMTLYWQQRMATLTC